LKYFDRFWKNIKFREKSPVGEELFDVARRTDTTKLTPAFRNFANAPANACNKWKHAGLDVLQAANI